jgi:type IV pilus modification protein PilV
MAMTTQHTTIQAGPSPSARGRAQRGFTVIEVMIALTILLVGIAGLLSMQLTAMRATSFSRHATEASMLAEDKMEALRTEPFATLVSGTETEVDSRGLANSGGIYTRDWTVTVVGSDTFVKVEVAWPEQGGEVFRIGMTTVRNQ